MLNIKLHYNFLYVLCTFVLILIYICTKEIILMIKLRIEEVMELKGISTQKELAEKIGMSEAGLSKALRGNPKLDTLERIALELDVEITDLFESDNSNKVRCPFCQNTIQLNKS